jgi:CDI immunity proteins
MKRPLDRTKTLDQLDPPAWGEPDFHSHLVRTCHALRRKPIREFVVEDLRIMIGQEIGLPWLVPLALEVLEQNPLAEGDYYPGDLLRSVLTVDSAFWSREWEWRDQLKAVFKRLKDVPNEVKDALEAFQSQTG